MHDFKCSARVCKSCVVISVSLKIWSEFDHVLAEISLLVFLTLLTPAGYQQYCRNKHWQLMQRRNSPETGKENMQVCPAITHSRLNTLRPWMQESESSVRVSQIFFRLVHAEKQISACTPRPATRQHATELSQQHTSEPLRYSKPTAELSRLPLAAARVNTRPEYGNCVSVTWWLPMARNQ
jgi:hypothetical protein